MLLSGKISIYDHIGYNNETGDGTWQFSAGVITFKWKNSATVEKWELPVNPAGQKGSAVMKGKPYTLTATRQ